MDEIIEEYEKEIIEEYGLNMECGDNSDQEDDSLYNSTLRVNETGSYIPIDDTSLLQNNSTLRFDDAGSSVTIDDTGLLNDNSTLHVDSTSSSVTINDTSLLNNNSTLHVDGAGSSVTIHDDELVAKELNHEVVESDFKYTVVYHDGEVEEISPIDVQSETKKFIEEGCCPKRCVSLFSEPDISTMRSESLLLDYYDDKTGIHLLNTVMMGNIRILCNSNEQSTHARQQNERKRSYFSFTVNGKSVCRKFFLFVHFLTEKKFKRLMRLYKESGFAEVYHKNKNRPPHNIPPHEHLEWAVRFIKNYADEMALCLPGRQSTQYRICKLLPVGTTKKVVYEEYAKSIAVTHGDDIIPISLGLFRRIWAQCCNDVVVCKPKSDLCIKCQQFYTSKSLLLSKTVEEKLNFIKDCQMHLEKVSTERNYYRQTIDYSREQFQKSGLKFESAGTLPSNSYDEIIHVSFDYAQKVQIPHMPFQPGPIYFLVPYNVALFGVMNDSANHQGTYVIPESVDVSKGANSVISYLHHYMTNCMFGEKIVHFHADNCVAQNKNNYVLAYFVWRLAFGLNEEIRYSFLPVGHTKFGPDWAFGRIKKVFKSSESHCVEDVVKVVNKAADMIFAIPVGNEKNEVFVPTYGWDSFFKNHSMRTIPKITSYSHFVFKKSSIGTVECMLKLDSSAVSHVMFSENEFTPDETCVPSELLPDGLSAERQLYLFNRIREFVREDVRDLLCPKPSSMPEDECPSTSEQPAPRKRGRPPKASKDESQMRPELLRSDEEDDPLPSKSSNKTLSKKKTPRKRIQPLKKKLSKSSEEDDSINSPPKKKKPRKKKVLKSSEEDDSLELNSPPKKKKVPRTKSRKKVPKRLPA